VSTDDETAAWAKAQQACFETDPIVEMRGSEKVAVGFVLNLYAKLPMDVPPGEARRTASAGLWDRLRGILDQALEGGDAQVDVDPPKTAAVLRPENEMIPEVALRARIRHKEAWKPLTAGEREGMSAFEKKLSALGLRAGHW
jgi:hypothetical protein